MVRSCGNGRSISPLTIKRNPLNGNEVLYKKFTKVRRMREQQKAHRHRFTAEEHNPAAGLMAAPVAAMTEAMAAGLVKHLQPFRKRL